VTKRNKTVWVSMSPEDLEYLDNFRKFLTNTCAESYAPGRNVVVWTRAAALRHALYTSWEARDGNTGRDDNE
jgi:hypothetical protein